MKLIQALRLGLCPRLALVGSGGKTTALFHIGRELLENNSGITSLPSPVLLAATTHMSVEQLEMADQHFVLESAIDIAKLKIDHFQGLVLLTGPLLDDKRAAGLAMPIMNGLVSLADEYQFPFLVEADGSRQKPLKAPSENEPVIPGWVDSVVVVSGISGVGKVLSSRWVHRPERFSMLASVNLGDRITPEAVGRVLCNPLGGLKNIPGETRRIVLLNQAESAVRQATAYRLVDYLLPEFHAVVIAALHPPGKPCLRRREMEERSSGSPFLDRKCVYAVHERVAGIILAAGASSRMGHSKQVMLWRGEPLVRQVVQTALSAGLSPVVVVTGSDADMVKSAVQDQNLTIAHNANWEEGQSASINTGLNALPPETGAAIFLLADQPQIPVELVKKLREVHANTLAPIVAPRVQDRRANPVLFDRQVFPDLSILTGDIGGRALFSRYDVTWLPWHDEAIILDIDTLDDYHQLLNYQ